MTDEELEDPGPPLPIMARQCGEVLAYERFEDDFGLFQLMITRIIYPGTEEV